MSLCSNSCAPSSKEHLAILIGPKFDPSAEVAVALMFGSIFIFKLKKGVSLHNIPYYMHMSIPNKEC